jgi:FKBP-type peptidyl-prolyl cis-trans isomerase
MKNGLRLFCAATVAVALQASVLAQDNSGFKDEREKASYAIGMMWGNTIKRSGYDLDVEVIASALKDVVADKESKLSEAQAREAFTAYQQNMRKQSAEKNRKAGAEFLEANKKKEGVKTHSVTLPDGKTAELQYKVLAEGSGSSPNSNDVVTVNYRGTLLNGKEFDSSAKQGKPVEFPVNRVIRGWTEALKLMKPGAKWELYIPADLAYADAGAPPNIEPGSTLIFEVELLKVTPPAPPAASSQPLTSDIIRVPSAEELKKGAKIEVIKPEEAERLQKAATQK